MAQEDISIRISLRKEGAPMETQDREMKSVWDSKYLKTLCAFANTAGGIMIIGIADNGTALGVADPQYQLKLIPDDIRNALDIISFVEAITIDGKTCIGITVKKGSRYVDLRGVFYKRVGNTTQRVTGEELQSWILSNIKSSWTDLPAEGIKIDDLSQDALKFFVKKGTASGRMSTKAAESDNEYLLKNYKMMNEKGLLNSAAILFLDEPGKMFTPASVNIGEYDEDDRLLRLDSIDCPIILQPDRVMDKILNKYIKGVDDIVGLMRVTKYPYPEKALREGIMNAICHRDYFGAELTYVRVYPNRIEISNPGRLPPGWTEKDLLGKHTSVLTNPRIAHAFHDIGYIERFGSGIKMMRDECKAMNVPEPEYNLEKGRVEIVFRLPEKKNDNVQTKTAVNLSDLTDTESKTYALIREGTVTTAIEMSKVLGITDKTVKRVVAKLVEKGLVKRIGSKNTGRWIAVEE
jgi:ATP-dependent DNA helicase RecG